MKGDQGGDTNKMDRTCGPNTDCTIVAFDSMHKWKAWSDKVDNLKKSSVEAIFFIFVNMGALYLYMNPFPDECIDSIFTPSLTKYQGSLMLLPRTAHFELKYRM